MIGAHSLKDFFSALKRPRKVMFMVKAGAPVDELIEECLPFLEKGDIVIDGGNSHYPDTERRVKTLKEKGISFIGAGVSGGEEGARHGPSIMPGGNPDGWPALKPIFQAISAKAKEDGLPCCEWIGEGGAGHYVKMVHNGIEYGDMQLISEAYFLLKKVVGCTMEEMETIFHEWNQGVLNSFLIEITAQIFAHRDTDGKPLLDKILDVAGQKGTGKWTGSAPSIWEFLSHSLQSRSLPDVSLRSKRSGSRPRSSFLSSPFTSQATERPLLKISQALYASKIISYAQGFMLMRAAATEMKWKLDYGSIALIWREGCIIRSRFLNDIKKAYDKNSNLANLLFDSFFHQEITRCRAAWRRVVV